MQKLSEEMARTLEEYYKAKPAVLSYFVTSAWIDEVERLEKEIEKVKRYCEVVSEDYNDVMHIGEGGE